MSTTKNVNTCQWKPVNESSESNLDKCYTVNSEWHETIIRSKYKYNVYISPERMLSSVLSTKVQIKLCKEENK